MHTSPTDLTIHPHKRYNILTGEWILVSPHRALRPWQGKTESAAGDELPPYDPACYLCPGNTRADGGPNPVYGSAWAFTNDFSALRPDTPKAVFNEDNLLIAHNESGICRVICFSPRHDLTLPLMTLPEIGSVVRLWCEEFENLSRMPGIKYIQVFENKGGTMGCSNPHPHGQIWAGSGIPQEIVKETQQQESYFEKHGKSLLSAYLELELKKRDRIVCANEHFVALVPFWAVWPFETLLISRRQVQNIAQFDQAERDALAAILSTLTIRYDNLFYTSFPYSAGMHQLPAGSAPGGGWHWHMHFYPPLLRSATIRKFMVGYEMLAGPQRDITPEAAAEQLRSVSNIHYSLQNRHG